MVVLSVAAALANLTWRFAGEAGGPSAVTAAMDAYVPPAPPPDVSGMINLPPFGKAMVAATTAAAPPDLVLHGVLLANPMSASSALIAAGGKESAAYRLGDPMPGGMILNAIGVDYVILRLGEQYLTLYFPGDQRTGQSAALPGAPGAGTPGAAAGTQGLRDIKTLLPPSLTGRAPPAPPVTTTPPPPPPQVPPPAQNGSGGNALIDSIGANVTPQGYRVGSTLSPQLQAAGLAPGDVVASVNGVSAATLAGDPRRLAQAMGSGEARLEVLRGGNRITLSVPAR
jgi:general secretion pathway protein C